MRAILIDGVGRHRRYHVQDGLREIRVPMPSPPRVVASSDDLPASPSFPVARFVLSSVIDGVAVYRWAPEQATV